MSSSSSSSFLVASRVVSEDVIALTTEGEGFEFDRLSPGEVKRVTDAAIAPLLSRNLRRVNLAFAGISDETVRRLKKLPHLEHLNLAMCEIREVVDVASLDVSMTRVTEVAASPTLTRLNVEACDLNDDAARVIGACENLTNLNISLTKITDDGLKEIRCPLRVLKARRCGFATVPLLPRTLDVRGNRIARLPRGIVDIEARVEGNPLRCPPVEVVAAGHLRQYFDDLLADGEIEFARLRCVCVGCDLRSETVRFETEFSACGVYAVKGVASLARIRATSPGAVVQLVDTQFVKKKRLRILRTVADPGAAIAAMATPQVLPVSWVAAWREIEKLETPTTVDAFDRAVVCLMRDQGFATVHDGYLLPKVDRTHRAGLSLLLERGVLVPRGDALVDLARLPPAPPATGQLVFDFSPAWCDDIGTRAIAAAHRLGVAQTWRNGVRVNGFRLQKYDARLVASGDWRQLAEAHDLIQSDLKLFPGLSVEVWLRCPTCVDTGFSWDDLDENTPEVTCRRCGDSFPVTKLRVPTPDLKKYRDALLRRHHDLPQLGFETTASLRRLHPAAEACCAPPLIAQLACATTCAFM